MCAQTVRTQLYVNRSIVQTLLILFLLIFLVDLFFLHIPSPPSSSSSSLFYFWFNLSFIDLLFSLSRVRCVRVCVRISICLMRAWYMYVFRCTAAAAAFASVSTLIYLLAAALMAFYVDRRSHILHPFLTSTVCTRACRSQLNFSLFLFVLYVCGERANVYQRHREPWHKRNKKNIHKINRRKLPRKEGEHTHTKSKRKKSVWSERASEWERTNRGDCVHGTANAFNSMTWR